VPVEREILDDGHFKNIQTNVSISRRELRTTKVMQLSEMKEIIGYGSSGRRGNRFQGAIVSDLSGRTIYGVQEGLFVVNVNCRAKHGLHSGAEFFFARRNSGIVNEYALISWDDKPNKLYWRPKSSIEESPVEETKQRTAVPDRFLPSEYVATSKPTLPKDAKQYYEFFRSKDLDTSYCVHKMPLSGDDHWMEQQEKLIATERFIETEAHLLKTMMRTDVSQKVLILFNGGTNHTGEDLYKIIKDSKALPNRIRLKIGECMQEYKDKDWFKKYMQKYKEGNNDGAKKNYDMEEEEGRFEDNNGAKKSYDTGEESTMIQGALDYYNKELETPDPKRPLHGTKDLPDIPHLELSLTLDVLRGAVKGTLGHDVDAELGLTDDQDASSTTGLKYLEYLEKEVQAFSIKERKKADKAKRQKYKKLCKLEGCDKYEWSGSGSGHCYNHAAQCTKMCTKCNQKKKKMSGGLCAGCSQQAGPGKRERVLCSCGARESVKQDSRCNICIGREQKKTRKNRGGN